MQFSYSKLSMFETCPYRYYLRYVCGIPEPPTEALQVGTATHAAISRLLKGEIDIDLVVEEEIRKQDLLSLEKHFPEVLKMVQNFASAFVRPTGSQVATEMALERGLGKHTIIGFADLVCETPGQVIITDFKTGWKRYGAEDTQQLALYSWMVRERFPGKVIKARLWWLRYRRGLQVEVEVNADGAAAWAERLIGEIADAAQWPGDIGYSRNVGTACGPCPFAGDCLGIHVPDDVRELAGLALRLEACLQRVKAALKKHVSAAGPVEIGGEVWDLYPRASWKFSDVRAVHEFLAEYVRDPWKYLKVDTQKIAPLLKGELGEDLRALGEEVKAVYLGHKPAAKEAAQV